MPTPRTATHPHLPEIATDPRPEPRPPDPAKLARTYCTLLERVDLYRITPTEAARRLRRQGLPLWAGSYDVACSLTVIIGVCAPNFGYASRGAVRLIGDELDALPIPFNRWDITWTGWPQPDGIDPCYPTRPRYDVAAQITVTVAVTSAHDEHHQHLAAIGAELIRQRLAPLRQIRCTSPSIQATVTACRAIDRTHRPRQQ